MVRLAAAAAMAAARHSPQIAMDRANTGTYICGSQAGSINDSYDWRGSRQGRGGVPTGVGRGRTCVGLGLGSAKQAEGEERPGGGVRRFLRAAGLGVTVSAHGQFRVSSACWVQGWVQAAGGLALLCWAEQRPQAAASSLCRDGCCSRTSAGPASDAAAAAGCCGLSTGEGWKSAGAATAGCVKKPQGASTGAVAAPPANICGAAWKAAAAAAAAAAGSSPPNTAAGLKAAGRAAAGGANDGSAACSGGMGSCRLAARLCGKSAAGSSASDAERPPADASLLAAGWAPTVSGRGAGSGGSATAAACAPAAAAVAAALPLGGGFGLFLYRRPRRGCRARGPGASPRGIAVRRREKTEQGPQSECSRARLLTAMAAAGSWIRLQRVSSWRAGARSNSRGTQEPVRN